MESSYSKGEASIHGSPEAQASVLVKQQLCRSARREPTDSLDSFHVFF